MSIKPLRHLPPRSFNLPKHLLWIFVIFFPVLLKSQLISTVAGNGVHANQGNNIPAVCAATSYPHGISLDGTGYLYLTCSNSIRKVNLSTGIITFVAGSDTWGHTGDGGPALAATMQFPFDLDFDNNGNLFITEYGGHCVRKINTNTGIISTVAGNGSAGYSGDGGPAVNATLDQPWGICTDAAGNIYIADNKNSRIRKITASTGIISTIAGNGSASYSGDGGPAINAGTPFPVDVAVDGNGNVYFIEVFGSNTSRVRKVNAATGIITTVAGNGTYSYSGDGGPAIAAGLFDPSGLFVDGPGNIYISEYDDSRIRKVDVSTGIINTIAGNGINGFSGDGGPALAASLWYPMGLELDANGDLYVADDNNQRIRKISPTITLPPALTASLSISSSPFGCNSAPVTFTSTFTSNGTSPVYNWYVNGTMVSTNPGTFSSSSLNNGDIVTCKVLITYCDNTFPVSGNSITVQFGGLTPPLISITATDTTICAGDNVVFTASPQNAGTNPSYQWTLNGSNTGTNSNTFTSSSLSDGDLVNCIITSDPVFTCGSILTSPSDTISMIVSSVSAPAITVSASANDICPKTPVTFTANIINGGPSSTYTWKLNGTVVGANNSLFSYSDLSNNDIVSCEANTTGNCSAATITSSVTMIVKALPVVNVLPADTIVSPGAQIQIRAAVSSNISSFQWSPAGGITNGNSLSPVTLPVNKDTEFFITVISADGCIASDTSTVKVFSKLFMPSAFTPNGDGLNDVFRIPPFVKLDLKTFSIYNRWGSKVFTTSDIKQGWDGCVGGVKQNSGVYVFYISGADDSGPVFLKGTVVLIR